MTVKITIELDELEVKRLDQIIEHVKPVEPDWTREAVVLDGARNFITGLWEGFTGIDADDT